MAKKWYESGWLWAAVGAGVFLFLRAKKAPGVIIEKIAPPWDPSECSPVSAATQPYISKFKEAAEAVYGAGTAGAVCVEVINVPGLTLDERTTITLQMFLKSGKDDAIALGLDQLKTRTYQELVSDITELVDIKV